MRKLMALLLASALGGCCEFDNCPVPDYPGRARAMYAHPDYEADLKGEDPGCCLLRDALPNGPLVLKQGNGDHGEAPAFGAKDGMLEMALSAPDGLPSGAAATVGIYRTGLSFRQGQYFSISATFQNPQRDKSMDAWTVLIIARTGDLEDASNLPRLQLSLQVVNGSVRLKVMEGYTADTYAIEDPDTKIKAIVNIDGQPIEDIYSNNKEFTLKLSVKQDGTGVALLTSPAFDPISIDFQTDIFNKTQGAPLRTVGAALANTAKGLPATVEVKHFEIWTH